LSLAVLRPLPAGPLRRGDGNARRAARCGRGSARLPTTDVFLGRGSASLDCPAGLATSCSSWHQRSHVADSANDTAAVAVTSAAAVAGCASLPTLTAQACMKKLTPRLSPKLF